MKRFLTVLLCVVFLLGLLSACKDDELPEYNPADPEQSLPSIKTYPLVQLEDIYAMERLEITPREIVEQNGLECVDEENRVYKGTIVPGRYSLTITLADNWTDTLVEVSDPRRGSSTYLLRSALFSSMHEIVGFRTSRDFTTGYVLPSADGSNQLEITAEWQHRYSEARLEDTFESPDWTKTISLNGKPLFDERKEVRVNDYENRLEYFAHLYEIFWHPVENSFAVTMYNLTYTTIDTPSHKSRKNGCTGSFVYFYNCDTEEEYYLYGDELRPFFEEEEGTIFVLLKHGFSPCGRYAVISGSANERMEDSKYFIYDIQEKQAYPIAAEDLGYVNQGYYDIYIKLAPPIFAWDEIIAAIESEQQ